MAAKAKYGRKLFEEEGRGIRHMVRGREKGCSGLGNPLSKGPEDSCFLVGTWRYLLSLGQED
jgi:hypothetical protein